MWRSPKGNPKFLSQHPCPNCGGPVYAYGARRQDPTTFCSKHCRAVLAGKRRQNPETTTAAVRARIREARQAIEQQVFRKYGEVSAREIELFNLGVRIGRERGYNEGYHAQRRARATVMQTTQETAA